MKEIKVLGTGCPKCKQTVRVVTEAVDELKLEDVRIEKVEDIVDIMQYNVMSTPAVVLNGEVVLTGRVPSKKEVEDLLMAVKN